MEEARKPDPGLFLLSPGSMPQPGDIYFLPPTVGEGPGKGNRPYVAVSVCPRHVEFVTLAYASTRSTYAARGAAHVVVYHPATLQKAGLSRPTFIYPVRLAIRSVDQLPDAAGQLVEDLPTLRAALRVALGLGHTATREANISGANRRGRVIEYVRSAATAAGTRYGLVITEPAFSRTRLHQITIPLLDLREYEVEHGDVLEPASAWTESLVGGRGRVIAAVGGAVSLYERDWILRYTDIVVSDETMRRVDAALVEHFDLGT